MSAYHRLVAQIYKVTHPEPKEEPRDATPPPTADQVDWMDSVMDEEVAA